MWAIGAWPAPPWRTLPRLALAFVLGALLAGLQLAPFAELAVESQRAAAAQAFVEQQAAALATSPSLAQFARFAPWFCRRSRRLLAGVAPVATQRAGLRERRRRSAGWGRTAGCCCASCRSSRASVTDSCGSSPRSSRSHGSSPSAPTPSVDARARARRDRFSAWTVGRSRRSGARSACWRSCSRRPPRLRRRPALRTRCARSWAPYREDRSRSCSAPWGRALIVACRVPRPRRRDGAIGSPSRG